MSKETLILSAMKSSSKTNRREFLFQMAGLAGLAAGAAIGSGVSFDAAAKKAPALAPEYFLHKKTRKNRKKSAYKLRLYAAKAAYKSGDVPLASNGDEDAFPTRIGNITKSLPHTDDGLVDPEAYYAFLRACTAGTPEAFESVPGGPLQLKNPLAGYAFTMEGADPYDVWMPPPPTFGSAEMAAEMVECYWQALLRDVPFSEYETNPLVGEAAFDLTLLPAFRGAPGVGGATTRSTLFRSVAPGVTTGPYISQFLLKDMLAGHTYVPQKYTSAQPGTDYLSTREEWLASQRGALTTHVVPDGETRYIITGRDLARVVHLDYPYQAALSAALCLQAMGAPTHPDDPYRRLSRQCGFATFGQPHIVDSIARVTTLALRTAWRHKWTLHRRTRPEEFAGRVHDHILSGAQFPIHPDLLASRALEHTYARWGSYLLTQAYPEGCPAHPAYPSGHATYIGATITMLKAFYNENFVIPNPVQPSPDGQSLVPYTGPPLTVGGELNKLASNFSMGRNFAGVHWRSDAWEGNMLGERVAVALLHDLKGCYMEPFRTAFTGLDGSHIGI